jgi:GNAT superfamily N-acetyltransferase
MWRASFEKGVGITDPHPLAEQRAYFQREILPCNSVRVALLQDRIVGFAAASRTSVAQLYVRLGFQRRGIGTLLLDWAKSQSEGSLWLYTFARNANACFFYERSGFEVVARGFEPTWQLEDVKYEWSVVGQNARSPHG